MINVTRYDVNEDVETGELFISPVPENIEGPYVAYDDYAALQQKLDAMAAENEALKKSLKGTVEWCYSDDLPETPATDDYLNSVRAEAVSYVADHIDSLQRNMLVSSNSLRDYAVMFRSGAHDTEDKAG